MGSELETDGCNEEDKLVRGRNQMIALVIKWKHYKETEEEKFHKCRSESGGGHVGGSKVGTTACSNLNKLLESDV